MINRLPHASTCENLLILCENYEMFYEGFNTFKHDLHTAFTNHEGFAELAYSRNYDINYMLQDEINGMQNSSSSTFATPARSIVQVQNSASTVRSSLSGNTISNVIYIDDDENNSLNELTDSFQVMSNLTSFIIVLNKILQ